MINSISENNRIDTILSLIPQSICLADIGCDHGKISQKALLAGRVQQVIAADISAASLAKAEKRMQAFTNVQFRVGRGLDVLQPGEAQTVCLTGMGGRLIIQILAASPHIRTSIHCFVLGPQRDAMLLREFLAGRGLCVNKEKIAQEKGHLYPIMQVIAGENTENDPFHYFIGYGEMSDPVYRMYLQDLLHRSEISIRAQTAAGHSDQHTADLISWTKRIRKMLTSYCLPDTDACLYRGV